MDEGKTYRDAEGNLHLDPADPFYWQKVRAQVIADRAGQLTTPKTGRTQRRNLTAAELAEQDRLYPRHLYAEFCAERVEWARVRQNSPPPPPEQG